MSAAASAVPTFRALPLQARAYVAAVVAAGAGCLAVASMHLQLQHPVLFAVLLAMGVATSAAKIDLPLAAASRTSRCRMR